GRYRRLSGWEFFLETEWSCENLLFSQATVRNSGHFETSFNDPFFVPNLVRFASKAPFLI
ncbi:MAG: hypothetical protein K5858_01855, partial [Lachnospiraceae bacterium]|nr:hypothetical protein [Lachnospiraceae bacterium]